MKPTKTNRIAFTLGAIAASLMLSSAPVALAADHDHHQHAAPAAADGQWQEAAIDVPDLTVVNQDGERKRFFTDLVKGQTVAINFIYTSCPSVCSPITATLKRAQQELLSRGMDEIRIISVSVDPVTDTPAVLKDFAQRFDIDPGWNFVTGEPGDIKRLLQAFGVPSTSMENHTPLIFVTHQPSGKWLRAFGLASPRSIADTVAEAAGVEPSHEVSVAPTVVHEHDAHSEHHHHHGS